MVTVKKRGIASLFLSLAGRQNRKDWAQSLAVIAIGGIAITLFCGFLSNSASLQRRVDRLISQSNAADIYVTTDPRDGTDLKEADLLLENIDGIRSVESRFMTYCTLQSSSALAVVEPRMPVLSRPYEIVDQSPTQTNSHFFIVDAFIAQYGQDKDRIEVGSTASASLNLSSFSLDSKTADRLDLFLKEGQENPFKKESLELKFVVTGLMNHIESAVHGSFSPAVFLCSNSYFRDVLRDTLLTSFTKEGVDLIWKLGFQKALGWGDGDPYGSSTFFPAPNQYLLRLEDQSTADATKQQILDYYGRKSTNNLYMCQTLMETTPVSTLKTELDQARQITFVFPVVFFLVALLVILISVRQMILKERLDIGTFKGLGVSRTQTHVFYGLKTFFLVGLGTLIGEILGPLIVPTIMSGKYSLLYSIPPKELFVVPWLHAILTAVVFIGTALLMTWWVARKEIKKRPVESMRPVPPTKKTKRNNQGGKGNLAKLSFTLAGRSIRGDLVKTAMVLIGVLGCTALLCCGYGIEDTINYGLNSDPLIVSGADATLFLADERSGDALKKDFVFLDDQGNNMLEGYQPFLRKDGNIQKGNETYYTTIHYFGAYEYGASKEARNHFPYKVPVGEVFISEKIAKQIGASVGDTVTFDYGGKELSFPVADIQQIFYDNGVFVQFSSSQFDGLQLSFNAAWLDAVPGKGEKVEKQARDIPGVALCESTASWKKRIGDAMGSVLLMTNAIKVFAFLLAAVVLYDLGLLNFKEKQREIATMKVLGFKQMEIMASLLIETLTLSIVGIGIGLALGFPFTKLVLFINQVQIVDFIYKMFPLTYVIAFGFTFLISLAVNLLLTFRIRKIMAVESLKSVE